MDNRLIISFALVVVMVFWTAYRVRANRKVFVQTTLFGVGLLALGGLVAFLWPLARSIPELSGGRTDGRFAKDAGSEKYTLDGRSVTLTNGIFQESYDAWLNRPRNPYDNAKTKAAYLSPEPLSAGRIATVQLTTKRVVGDVSSDGLPDEAVVFTFTAGGDSTYYFITLRRTNGNWAGATTNSLQLGDRISVEAIRIEAGKVVVDTLDRKPGESPTVPPSVRITRTFRDIGGAIEETK